MPLAANLNLTPADAARYFRGKANATSWDYTDIWRGDNALAFTVAKATTLDVVSTIRKEVDRAIGSGITFAEFKRALRPRLQDLGWWGTQEVLDADTGEINKAQLGSNRRLRTIYQTNVQTAYMAGRYRRLVDDAQSRPYWRYVAVMDGRTRPEHAALNGRVWRWDDPVWAVIFPPNGWGCRCRVTAMTAQEFEASGLKLESGAGSIVDLQVSLGREGKKVAVQGVRYTDHAGKQKVFRPDPGWDYNPGAAWAQHDPAGFNGTARAVDGLPTWKDAGRPDLRDAAVPRQHDPGLLPAAPSRDLAARQLSEVLLAGEPMREVQTPVDPVFIRPELLPHVVEKAQDARERYANFILPTLQKPFEIWLTFYTDGTYRKRYIGLFAGASNLMVVVRENRDGTLFWEVYNAMNADAKKLNKQREGTLLYGQDLGEG